VVVCLVLFSKRTKRGSSARLHLLSYSKHVFFFFFYHRQLAEPLFLVLFLKGTEYFVVVSCSFPEKNQKGKLCEASSHMQDMCFFLPQTARRATVFGSFFKKNRIFRRSFLLFSRKEPKGEALRGFIYCLQNMYFFTTDSSQSHCFWFFFLKKTKHFFVVSCYFLKKGGFPRFHRS
jgi:hypothetical protein